mgnify:CR=1 FL=1
MIDINKQRSIAKEMKDNHPKNIAIDLIKKEVTYLKDRLDKLDRLVKFYEAKN